MFGPLLYFYNGLFISYYNAIDIYVHDCRIGLHISTKIPRRLFENNKTRKTFNDARLDITENYKYPEGN